MRFSLKSKRIYGAYPIGKQKEYRPTARVLAYEIQKNLTLEPKNHKADEAK